MDAICDPAVQDVVAMLSSQVGKTEIINNTIGYYVDHDPCPMLVIQPTLQMGESWSKDRLMPMARDTHCLTAKIGDMRSREKGATIMHKAFAGGHITIAGANSPASLAARPVRLVLCDEPDRYPASAKAEGDPVTLARRRTATFWNRKIVLVSTPTIQGASRIEAAFETSTRERFHVPCVHCDGMQTLKWANVRWTEGGEDAMYACQHCGGMWSDVQRWAAVRLGEWRAENPNSKTRGFHLNEIYSPWTSLPNMVAAYLEARPHPEQFKAWINTALGETWKQKGAIDIDVASWEDERGEHWDALPSRALIVTAGVDVQGGQRSRLELEIVAWSEDLESWSCGYHVIPGDVKLKKAHPASPWRKLDEILARTYLHESGNRLKVSAVLIDSGYLPDMVYQYTKPLERRGYAACKGMAGQGSAIIRARTESKDIGAKLITLGVDTLKGEVYEFLSQTDPGPGFLHFPLDRDANYYEGLTSETPMRKSVKGFPTIVWTIPDGKMNEPLDCRNYARGALEYRRPQWRVLQHKYQSMVDVSPPPRAKRRRQISAGI